MILDFRLTILDWEAQGNVRIFRGYLNAGSGRRMIYQRADCHGQWTTDYGLFYFRF